MTHYLDIGVVQIQPWLARAPSLKGRRGASTMLRRATEPTTIHPLLAPMQDQVQLNDEVGAIDGVVHLTLATGQDQLAAEASQLIVRHLRHRLPHATLRVSRAEGEHYAGRTPRPALDWPPSVSEWPLARPCAWCRTAPGQQVSGVDGNAVLCGECAQRSEHAGTAQGTVPPGPEHDLLELLGRDRPLPDSFAELAGVSLGPVGDDTHLATVYADGNAIGAFVDQLKRNHPDLLAQVPSRIHDATWAAVLAGVAAVDTGQSTLPVVPHLVGGDDILVSLPAHGAWDFVDAALTTFASALADLAPGPIMPSLSAAIVFHHNTFPLSATVDLAADLLKNHAKRRHPATAAIAWHSVTHDGAEPTTRPPLSHASLTAHRQHLTAAAAIAPSQRHTLAHILADPDTRAPDVYAHLERMNLRELTEPFLDPAGITLADALDMVRWWRT